MNKSQSATNAKTSMESIGNGVNKIDIVNIPKVTTFDNCFKTEVTNLVDDNINSEPAPLHDIKPSSNIMAGDILTNFSCEMD